LRFNGGGGYIYTYTYSNKSFEYILLSDKVVRFTNALQTFESVILFTPVLSRTTFRLYLLSTVEA